MTSAAHERATDRVAEAAEHFAADIVVMIQGDEPMITPTKTVNVIVGAALRGRPSHQS